MRLALCRDVELADVDEAADMLLEHVDAGPALVNDDDADLDMLAPMRSRQTSRTGESGVAGFIENKVCSQPACLPKQLRHHVAHQTYDMILAA